MQLKLSDHPEVESAAISGSAGRSRVWPDESADPSSTSQPDAGPTVRELLDEHYGQIRHALLRLQQGQYQSCETCGAKIPAERLQFRPEATRCACCQLVWDCTHRVFRSF